MSNSRTHNHSTIISSETLLSPTNDLLTDLDMDTKTLLAELLYQARLTNLYLSSIVGERFTEEDLIQ